MFVLAGDVLYFFGENLLTPGVWNAFVPLVQDFLFWTTFLNDYLYPQTGTQIADKNGPPDARRRHVGPSARITTFSKPRMIQLVITD